MYNLHNQLDEDNFNQDKKDMEDLIFHSLDWMKDNQDGVKDDYLKKQKEVETLVVNPIMRQMHSGGNGGGDHEEDFDDGDDE